MNFSGNLNKLLLIGTFLIGGSMKGNCVSLSPETELNLRNIQYKMRDSTSPSSSQISELSIIETVLPTTQTKFNKILKESIQQNECLLDYLLERIYYGNMDGFQIFQDKILLDTRIQYIEYISKKVFLDWISGKAKVEQAIIALHAIISYCKEYAKNIDLFSQKKQLNSLYTQVQHESSSSEDETY